MAAENSAERIVDETVLLRTDSDGVATLTLNRPDAYNALSEELLAALQTELNAICNDSAVRVVVLEGNGSAFCAGHDLKQMRANPSREYYDSLFNTCSQFMLTLMRIPQPVIAKVHGIATAAGCQLVGTCDLAIASDKAQFATSGINYGLFCSTPAVAVSRNIHRKKAAELLFTGEFIDASTAESLGLINKSVAAENLDAAVLEMAESIIRKSAIAVATGKRMLYRQMEMGIDDAYKFAAETMACNMMAFDAGEGIDAFIEKRSANWKHV
ncbi:MAG: enoyl-CoA hydratase [Betaproteobacteria bacterium TMED22]|nr:MAG: enoyl-CoA hydratase [Betaproteobacteria bacterium TMED22]|tara:strand:+ start:3051 stop:3860 length:810 start_codon:yes stop_codon:yes gene_type:complete